MSKADWRELEKQLKEETRKVTHGHGHLYDRVSHYVDFIWEKWQLRPEFKKRISVAWNIGDNKQLAALVEQCRGSFSEMVTMVRQALSESPENLRRRLYKNGKRWDDKYSEQRHAFESFRRFEKEMATSISCDNVQSLVRNELLGVWGMNLGRLELRRQMQVDDRQDCCECVLKHIKGDSAAGRLEPFAAAARDAADKVDDLVNVQIIQGHECGPFLLLVWWYAVYGHGRLGCTSEILDDEGITIAEETKRNQHHSANVWEKLPVVLKRVCEILGKHLHDQASKGATPAKGSKPQGPEEPKAKERGAGARKGPAKKPSQEDRRIYNLYRDPKNATANLEGIAIEAGLRKDGDGKKMAYRVTRARQRCEAWDSYHPRETGT